MSGCEPIGHELWRTFHHRFAHGQAQETFFTQRHKFKISRLTPG
jgi:hypothetical protein